jgi:hypothetical protein
MLEHKKALWRVEFRSDLTRAHAPSFRVAYLLETHWVNEVRWLGMLFRKRLTAAELDLVDTQTWPEMGNLEKFMTGLFDEAWAAGSDPKSPLGSNLLSAKYSMHSALRFAGENPDVNLNSDDPVQSFPALYGCLLDFRDLLSPVMTAPVVPFRAREPAAPGTRADVELTNKAA